MLLLISIRLTLIRICWNCSSGRNYCVSKMLYRNAARRLFPKNLTQRARSWSNMSKNDATAEWKSLRTELNLVLCVVKSPELVIHSVNYKCEHVLNARSRRWCKFCLFNEIKQNVAYAHTPWFDLKARMRHMRINLKLIHTWMRRLADNVVSVCRETHTFSGVLLLWLWISTL